VEIFQKTDRLGKVMNGLLLHTFFILFTLVLASKLCANPPNDFNPQIDESVKQKFDPSILMELERLKKEEQISKSLKIIVRTKGKINDSQEKQMEELGLTIGSISGDIFTATGPLTAVLKTASFDFIIHIELSRKLRQK
jgi:hypothetical protein